MGHTLIRIAVRVLQGLLALTAVIWHNDKTGQATPRSLIAYDHSGGLAEGTSVGSRGGPEVMVEVTPQVDGG